MAARQPLVTRPVLVYFLQFRDAARCTNAASEPKRGKTDAVLPVGSAADLV